VIVFLVYSLVVYIFLCFC